MSTYMQRLEHDLIDVETAERLRLTQAYECKQVSSDLRINLDHVCQDARFGHLPVRQQEEATWLRRQVDAIASANLRTLDRIKDRISEEMECYLDMNVERV